MRLLKRIAPVLKVLIIVLIVIFKCGNGKANAQLIPPSNQTPIKIEVLLYDFNYKYISLMRQSFEEIQRNNQGKVEFTFYDGMDDQ